MKCPICGTQLDDNAKECYVCGYRIEENAGYGKNHGDEQLEVKSPESSHELKSEKNDVDIPAESKKKSKNKRGRIIVLVCVIVAACIVVILFFTMRNSSASSETGIDLENETDMEEDSTGVSTGENVAPNSGYIGYWNISGNEDEELTISNVTDSTVEFSLFSRGIYNLEDAVAHIDENNFASFACVDGKLMMTGNLIFYDDYIVVDIDRADMDYIDTGTMVFDERHLSSWHGDDNENVNSQSTTSQNTANSNEAEPYYESGNISTYYDSYYILPDSSTRLLDYNDIRYLTKDELRLARNEIYARHGRKFDDPTLQAYFNSQPWYVGTIEPEDFTQSMLSSIERSNIAFIESYE